MRESQNIEWKSVWKDEYLKWICGFANANGGKLFIGKDDNGETVRLAEPDKLMEILPNKIKSKLGIICDVDMFEESSGLKYIQITVNKYSVAISYDGKYYYRSGTTNQPLEGPKLTELILRKSGKTWDDVVEPNAIFDDIEQEVVRTFLDDAEKVRRVPVYDKIENINFELVFENLRLTDNGSLKRAALLLFGKDPRKFYPNAFIKLGKFGNSDSDLQFQDIIEGSGYVLADKTIEILERKYLKSPISYKGLRRSEETEYPFNAIREVLLNAIIHKGYYEAPIQISVYYNKIIVWNEGELSIPIEELKIKHPSKPRHPVIADICFKGGLIEAWGRGTIKIYEECEENNLPEPEIKVVNGGVQVTIYNGTFLESDLRPQGLNNRQVEILKYLKLNKSVTNKEYTEKFGVSRNTASRDLNDLVNRKFVRSTGLKGLGASYSIYIKII